METAETQRLIQSGRVLCFIGNVANTGVRFDGWVSTGVILSSDGSRPVLGKNMRATTGWISTFIARDCENPDEIAAFLDYMTSKEGLSLWHYGREGADYYVGEDGCYYEMKTQDAVAAEEELGIWWMFSNTAWHRSVQAVSDEDICSNQAMTAYGMNPETVLYDSSLLILPANLISSDSAEGKIEKAVAEWRDSQIIKVVLAESEAEFEREYESLIQGLYDRGIEELDRRRGEAYRANCQEYGSSIQKVNKERKTER